MCSVVVQSKEPECENMLNGTRAHSTADPRTRVQQTAPAARLTRARKVKKGEQYVQPALIRNRMRQTACVESRETKPGPA